MNFDNNNNNNTVNNLELELQIAESAVQQAQVQVQTLREAIAEDQRRRQTASAASYQVTLPNGQNFIILSQNDPRMSQPVPAGATLQPKTTANAGAGGR